MTKLVDHGLDVAGHGGGFFGDLGGRLVVHDGVGEHAEEFFFELGGVDDAARGGVEGGGGRDPVGEGGGGGGFR